MFRYLGGKSCGWYQRDLGSQLRKIHAIDNKWLQKWESLVKPDGSIPYGMPTTVKSKPYYQLSMIPYPSGDLHIGHLRVYTISDTLARYRRMRGYKVRHPIGWDAFGLPAENAAIEHGVSASQWTYSNIDKMRLQLRRMLISFDWESEIITSSPDYYKHTQQLFLELYRDNLAYRRLATVNWDPVDQTVLANEQIDDEGRSWRSGAIAEKRELEQWFLRITEFADVLNDDLKLLENWPEMVKTMQRNWIGISHGARVKFSDKLWAFTTRVDTLPGVKFVALSADHPLAKEHAVSARQDTGLIEGIEALNPLTGEPLPVYVADYVVSDYAEGMVMGVPAHDQRDAKFWRAVCPATVDIEKDLQPFMSDDPQEIKRVQSEIMIKLAPKKLAEYAKQTRLRDWLISRQRFWGAPIPIIHCDNCGVVPVPEKDLPVRLPENQTSVNVPLSQNEEWLSTECPQCQSPAKRDPDTMDTFMDSSWYFFRNLDSQNANQPFEFKKVSHGNMPVDFYLGGVEHAILHLLYSRFLAKFLHRGGKWDGGDVSGEPFRKLVTLGMVNGKAYRDKATGKYLKPDEVKQHLPENLIESVEKMSKSKFNGTNPLEIIEIFGADAVRAHMLFQAPVTELLLWETDKIVGITRWFRRIEQIPSTLFSTKAQRTQHGTQNGQVAVLWNQVVNTVAQITSTMEEAISLNTVISSSMKLTKIVLDLAKIDYEKGLLAYESLLKIIAPFAPAQADEFWEQLCIQLGRPWTSVHHQKWPDLEPLKTNYENETAPFKVIMGKQVQTVYAPSSISEDELLAKLNVDRSNTSRVVFKPGQRLLSIVHK